MAIKLLILLLLTVGIVWLQIFLSRKQNKWAGLVIPFICFLVSIIFVFSLPSYKYSTITNVTKTFEGANVVQETSQLPAVKPSVGEILTLAVPVFIYTNIPTLIFLGIYFAFREKRKINLELEKMNIQDLE